MGERGGTAFPFRFWRGNAVPRLHDRCGWTRGERGVPLRPLHHQLRSKYRSTDNFLLGLKFCYTLLVILHYYCAIGLLLLALLTVLNTVSGSKRQWRRKQFASGIHDDRTHHVQ